MGLSGQLLEEGKETWNIQVQKATREDERSQKRVTDTGECKEAMELGRLVLGEGMKFQERADSSHEGSKGLPFLVRRISIWDITKETEKIVREKCPKSQRRGITFYVMGTH